MAEGAKIFNTTSEIQKVKAAGNHFEFKPKEVKFFYNTDIAAFIADERKHQGLVALPDEFLEHGYEKTPEGELRLAEFEQAGLDAYLGHLRTVIANNQVSLRQDLEKANLKIDPALLASKGELEAMRTVAKYQRQEEDRAQQKVDEVKELMKKVGTVSK